MQTGNGSNRTTQELVEDTIAGNAEAFARLVDRYRDAASAVAYSYFGGFDDVQDAVQEAFVHAYCNLSQLREPAKFGPWLRKIAASSCAMALRKRERSNVSLDEIAEQPSTSDDARKIAARIVVRDALAKLSDATRLTVTLSYIDGYSHAEVAEFLEVPITAVRSRLRHAKRKLREEMISMVSEVLHEDKPGEELARKIVEFSSRTQGLMIAQANNEALQLCDEAIVAIRDLSQSVAPEEFRELLVRTVESKADFQGDKKRALDNLKTWTVEEIKVREQAEALLGKGEVLLRLDDVDGAKSAFDEAAALIGSIDNKEASAKVIASIAHAYARNYQNALARDWLPLAIDNAKTNSNVPAEAMHTWTLAATYLQDDQPALARPIFEKAGNLYEQSNQTGFAVVTHAILNLMDEVGEERWKSLEQWIGACLALRRTGDRIENTDRGLVWGSKPDERDWRPQVGILFNIDPFGQVFDASLPAGSSWTGDTRWLEPAHLETTTTIVGYGESVETSLGRFSDCMLMETVVRDNLKGDEAEETKTRVKRTCGKRWSWFAPGVGLVRFLTESEGGNTSAVDLNEYEIAEPSSDYLPLAIGNSWTYGWLGAHQGRIAKERYRVAANEGEDWYLENYRYVLK